MSADAAKASFDAIKSVLSKQGRHNDTKGKIVIATVKGDIHDIGKNIVKTLLENYGFEMIDLGKDVPPELILQTVQEQHVKLVGLSALMTTTVVYMEETIKLLHDNHCDCKIMVGGAVLTQEYADMIGADFYSKDAMGSVVYAKRSVRGRGASGSPFSIDITLPVLYTFCINCINTVKKGESCVILIDYKDRRPIYEQIVEKFQQMIICGVIEPDSPMPSVRSLAMELSINPNTIQRAYQELEREGYIYTMKGKGALSANQVKRQTPKEKRLRESG